MQKYILLLLIPFLVLLTSCNEGLHTSLTQTKQDQSHQAEIDSILTTYSKHASMYSEIYPKALYGDKKALKEYSDLMLEINMLDNKLTFLINQNKIATNQLKKYKNLKKQFAQ